MGRKSAPATQAILITVMVLALSGCWGGASKDPDASPPSPTIQTLPGTNLDGTDDTDTPDTPGGSDDTNPTDRGGDASPGAQDVVTIPAPERKTVRKRVRKVAQHDTEAVDPTALPVDEGALAALEAQRAEYEHFGWTMSGKATVVRQRVLSHTTAPETVVVEACIDDSAIRVVDSEGVEVDRPTAGRALNLYTLVKKKDRWVITDIAYPDDPSC